MVLSQQGRLGEQTLMKKHYEQSLVSFEMENTIRSCGQSLNRMEIELLDGDWKSNRPTYRCCCGETHAVLPCMEIRVIPIEYSDGTFAKKNKQGEISKSQYPKLAKNEIELSWVFMKPKKPKGREIVNSHYKFLRFESVIYGCWRKAGIWGARFHFLVKCENKEVAMVSDKGRVLWQCDANSLEALQHSLGTSVLAGPWFPKNKDGEFYSLVD